VHAYALTLRQLSDCQLEEEFRYLQKKKNVARELAETRLKVNIVCILISAKVLTSGLHPECDIPIGID